MLRRRGNRDKSSPLVAAERPSETGEIIAGANWRKLADWRSGWDVSLRLDRWEAFTYYGYDTGDSLG